MSTRQPQNISAHNSNTPLWMLFPGAFIFVALTHFTLLRLPYYWDEAGYYIPAAWDFFRTGSLIPTTSTPNAHPPLESILLASWWRIAGFTPCITRLGICMVAAAALLGVYRMALMLLPASRGRTGVAFVTALLTALYPIWFAQSTLAHADLFAAAATIWALSFYFERGVSEGTLAAGNTRQRLWVCLLFSLAALAKETSIVTPLTLASAEIFLLLREKRIQLRTRLSWIAALTTPVLPLAAWYFYLRRHTGHLFGDAAFVRYNATSTLQPLRLLMALGHRTLHLTAHMNLFIPVACMLGAMLLPPLMEHDGTPRQRIPLPLQAILGIVLLANLLEFSVLGGALLTRYLLPMYPLVLVECVATWHTRVRGWWMLAAFSAIAFIAGIFINPPYGFSPEDNLAYRDFTVLQQDAIAQTLALHPRRVLTSWPASDEMRRPELGYVDTPTSVEPVDNFSREALENMLAHPHDFDTVLIFSTKYDPPGLWLNLGRVNERLDTRYFGYHRDLTAEDAAELLDATIVWREEHGGLWAAVLRMNPVQDAVSSPTGLAPAPRHRRSPL
jgi:hypothetical protein